MLLECSSNTYISVRIHLEYCCTPNVTPNVPTVLQLERSRNVLTHLYLDKMFAISQTMFLDAFSWKKSFGTNFVANGLINYSALV